MPRAQKDGFVGLGAGSSGNSLVCATLFAPLGVLRRGIFPRRRHPQGQILSLGAVLICDNRRNGMLDAGSRSLSIEGAKPSHGDGRDHAKHEY
jgi:hypothetical protein